MRKTILVSTLLTLALLATVALSAAEGGCSPAGSYPGWTLVDTRFVSAYGPFQTVHPASSTPVESFTNLNPGMTYRIEASGTFYPGANITADAEYSQRDGYGPLWWDEVPGYESYGDGLCELKIDDGFVEWGEYNPNHVYTLDRTATADALTLQIADFYPMNNTGGLCAALYCPPSVVWLPPITLPDWTLNENANLPIKFQLKDCSGNILTTDVGPSLTVSPYNASAVLGDLAFSPDEDLYIAHFRPGVNGIHTANVSFAGVDIDSHNFEVVEAGKANGKGHGK